MWNNVGDELVNQVFYTGTASGLDSLGYRYELDQYQPCANPSCSPVFPNHLQLAINDQYAPAAEFLGTHRVKRDPAHVTYVLFPQLNREELELVGDHAYWVSHLTLRDGGEGRGQIDAISHGFGVGDPTPTATQFGVGTLPDGNLGTLAFTRQFRTWGDPPKIERDNRIDVTATNLATASIHVDRARVNCNVDVNITTDGPIAVKLPGCGRTIQAG